MEIYHIDFIRVMAANYPPVLRDFIREYDIEAYFNPPIDHFAFKVIDGEEYEQAVMYLQKYGTEGYEARLDNRRIATILLKEPVGFGELGDCNVAEVIELKPDRLNKTHGLIDHIEKYKNKAQIERFCKNTGGSGLVTNYRAHQGHDSLEMEFVSGQGVKFTTVPLYENVLRQVTTGTTYRIF